LGPILPMKESVFTSLNFAPIGSPSQFLHRAHDQEI
jgi:hypothetical protein